MSVAGTNHLLLPPLSWISSNCKVQVQGQEALGKVANTLLPRDESDRSFQAVSDQMLVGKFSSPLPSPLENSLLSSSYPSWSALLCFNVKTVR